MTIVDQQHAAEIVTKKGKPFKYDAIECMVRDIKNEKENEFSLFLINDYSRPGNLVDAKLSTYLISENLPSPMGANLTGFQNKEEAQLILKEKNGRLYTWTELKELFAK
jgi:copper chaperone NosL